MLSFLLAIHFLLAILIIGLVLIQKHESDGILGTGGGGAGKIFSVRGQANLLTRSTAALMTLFFINCLIMAKMVKHTPQQGSLIDKVAKESVPVKSENANGNAEKTDGQRHRLQLRQQQQLQRQSLRRRQHRKNSSCY